LHQDHETAAQRRFGSKISHTAIPIRLFFLSVCVLTAFAGSQLHAKGWFHSAAAQDSDGDGLSDKLEAALLARFAPVFMVSSTDCSVLPARFAPELSKPVAMEDDGTIYGQAFPRRGHPGEIELHYYHLWRRDCGELDHALDAEHVAALIEFHGNPKSAKALYWYAAAHEDTICDASHLARAGALGAEHRGATVWISAGKHGSFLSPAMCRHGCGGDRCDHMKPLHVREIVNLGELASPMNGIQWLRSGDWPLRRKLERSDFTDSRLARLGLAPANQIVWATPSRRPAQAAILGVNAGLGGAGTGAQATDGALDTAHADTSAALETASERTGEALNRSAVNVWKAIKKSAERTGVFLQHDK
jgi:hypothetical protein